MRLSKFAGFGLLLLAMIALFSFFKLHRPALWQAVSPAYTAAAEAAMPGLGRGSVVVPFCFELRRDGQVMVSDECRDFLKAHPHPAACGLQNLARGEWDSTLIAGESAQVSRAIADIAHEMDCQTLVLDIESLHAGDRARFSKWIGDLSASLRQQMPGVYISLAVHAKTDDAGLWEGAAAQDWHALCASVDELLLMAYDFHYPGVTAAGEQAPIAWVAKVIDYARSVCPASHLRLGLAAYGFKWPKSDVVTEREWESLPVSVRGLPGGSPDFVETAAMRAEKMKLARGLGIDRFFVWALGMGAPR